MELRTYQITFCNALSKTSTPSFQIIQHNKLKIQQGRGDLAREEVTKIGHYALLLESCFAWFKIIFNCSGCSKNTLNSIFYRNLPRSYHNIDHVPYGHSIPSSGAFRVSADKVITYNTHTHRAPSMILTWHQVCVKDFIFWKYIS